MTQRAWILEGVAVGDGDEVADSVADRIIKIQTVTDTIGDFADISDETDKIDIAATNGMTGVSDSLAYHAHVTRRALNNYERWYALAAVPNLPTHAADNIGNTGVAGFVIDGGGGAGGSWGNWVQILGSGDTCIDPGKVYYNVHKLMITAAERANNTYFVQLGFGASGAAALAAYTYTEFVYKPASTTGEEVPYILRARRQAEGTLGWARCWCVSGDTGTLTFYLGTHEYEG